MTDLAGKVVRRSPKAASKELVDGSGAVVVHLDSGAYHRLNPIGTVIWNLLEKERHIGELLTAFGNLLEDPPPDLAEEVEEFLKELERRELIIRE